MQKALQKVQAAEDAWNTCDPERVALAYTEDSVWRNRDRFVTGRLEIIEFLRQKWQRELDYALRKQLWAFAETRIGVRFQYESRDLSGQYWRSYGNELWEFTGDGLMCRREASINDVPIDERNRRIHGPRPEAERGICCRSNEAGRRRPSRTDPGEAQLSKSVVVLQHQVSERCGVDDRSRQERLVG